MTTILFYPPYIDLHVYFNFFGWTTLQELHSPKENFNYFKDSKNICLLFVQTIDVDGEIDKISVDLSALEIMDTNTKTQLTDMSNAISDIDFDGLINSLSTDTVTADFGAITSSLESAAASIEGQASLASTHVSLTDGSTIFIGNL